MNWFLLGLLLGICYATIVLIAAGARKASQLAFTAGRRQGLKEAAAIARTRSEIAVQMAPSGLLMSGIVRAQMADQIEEDLFAELETVNAKV